MNPLPLLCLAAFASAGQLGTTRMMLPENAPVVVGPKTTAFERFSWATQAIERAIASSSDRLHRALLTTPEVYVDLLKLPYGREEIVDIGTSDGSRMRGWVILKKNFWRHHLRSLEMDAPINPSSAGQEVAASLRRAKLIQALRAIVADIDADEAFLRRETGEADQAELIERKRALFSRLEEFRR